jgi:hypothetical protein
VPSLGIPVRLAIICAVLGFLATVVFFAVGGEHRTLPTVDDDRRLVDWMCPEFVRSRLGSATTADFPIAAAALYLTTTGELPYDANQWQVECSLVVPMGANLPQRARFTCDVYRDGQTVQLLGVTIGD